jgi:hypothetical protein
LLGDARVQAQESAERLPRVRVGHRCGGRLAQLFSTLQTSERGMRMCRLDRAGARHRSCELCWFNGVPHTSTVLARAHPHPEVCGPRGQ